MAPTLPEEYELEHGLKLTLQYVARLTYILLTPLWIFSILHGDVRVGRPSSAVIETPHGETFVVQPPSIQVRRSGRIGLMTISNRIREIGLFPWLVERRDKTWSVRKKQIARYDELIRLVEEAANDV